jgi:predicted AAA+ superfamily ATPase
VDARRRDGQFILTGSATPADDATRHTGAGRISRLRMRTLSLAESHLSSGQVSLTALLDGLAPTDGVPAVEMDALIEETCHGGWPADRRRPLDDARQNVADFAEEISFAELRTLDVPHHDPDRVTALLRAVARNTATEASAATLAKDIGHAGTAVADATVLAYLRALERLMVVEPLPAWAPILRSRARVRSRAKHHLVDPALAAALMGAGPAELRRDLKTFGLLFESLAVRDLRVYAGAARAKVYHYRDNTGLEVNCVVDGGYGRWAAFEVKLSGAAAVVDVAAAKLAAFAAKVDTQTTGPPSVTGVITAEGRAYTRPDGVAVIPLAALGP